MVSVRFYSIKWKLAKGRENERRIGRGREREKETAKSRNIFLLNGQRKNVAKVNVTEIPKFFQKSK